MGGAARVLQGQRCEAWRAGRNVSVAREEHDAPEVSRGRLIQESSDRTGFFSLAVFVGAPCTSRMRRPGTSFEAGSNGVVAVFELSKRGAAARHGGPLESEDLALL